MLDISKTHPIAACAEFAMRWLTEIAALNLKAAEALIDENESGLPFADFFPKPDGFTYCPPDQIKDWTMHIVAAGELGLSVDFDLPFVEKDFRSYYARFDMKREGDSLVVIFNGLVPS